MKSLHEELQEAREALAQLEAIPDLNSNPNPGNTVRNVCAGPRGGWWETGADGVSRFYVWRVCTGGLSRADDEIVIPASQGGKLERWRCGYTCRRSGSECKKWAAVKFIDGKWITIRYCCWHIKGRQKYDVTLGKNGLYSKVFPTSMRERLCAIMDQPEAKNVSQELAVLKLFLENFLERQAKTFAQNADGGASSESELMTNTTMGVVAKLAALIGGLAKTQSDIDKQKENMMDIRQILVLLDAAMAWMLKRFGRGEDQRNLVLEMLPELPWPQGVAKITGSEGLIGVRGNLMLPKSKEEQAEPEVTATWASLEAPVREDVYAHRDEKGKYRQVGPTSWMGDPSNQPIPEEAPDDSSGKPDAPGTQLTNRFEYANPGEQKPISTDW